MEAEREKFRDYVEKSGLLSALTNALVNLYEQPSKPNDALEFIKEHLGSKAVDAKQLHLLEQKVKELEEENTELKDQLKKLKVSSEPEEAVQSEEAAPPQETVEQT